MVKEESGKSGKKSVVGGIISSNGKPSFRIVFPNQAIAIKYKDMMIWFLKDDGLDVEVKRGYFDKRRK